MKNMVDERFECASVIFRLAGRLEYSDLESDYQKEVAETFANFLNHEAVKYAKEICIAYDKVFKFAVHIEKKANKFLFIEDINSLFIDGWNEENAKKFLILFNEFYFDTGYESFFNSHLALFEKSTQKFINETYGKIDFEWFRKYIDPSNLRCIYSLSSGNYSATVNDKIVYCLVRKGGGAIVHEYCHSFSNSLAEKWYNENPKFKRLCDDSINEEKMPYYNSGWHMACEYVTRAYDILYKVQHGADLDELILNEKNIRFENSFKYIGEVFEMVLALENIGIR